MSDSSFEQFDSVAQTSRYADYGIGELTYPGYMDFRPNPRTFDQDSRYAYPFTTENMVDYVGKLGLSGARVAAISGSGDFTFNAVMEGAESVDCVDTMPTACMYAELKLLGIIGLDHPEFLEFFAAPNFLDGFSEQTYKRLRTGLSAQTRHYFDQAFIGNPMRADLVDAMLIRKIHDVDINVAMNPYLLSPQNYRTTQANIADNVRFHVADMSDFLARDGDSAYDTVYLSNISAYQSGNGQLDTLTNASQRIEPGGQIIDFQFVYPQHDRNEVETRKTELADQAGLTPEFLDAAVPHMDDQEPGHRALITVFKK